MKNKIKSFIRDESGATAIEYGIIALLIAIAIIISVRALGVNVTSTFTNVSNGFK